MQIPKDYDSAVTVLARSVLENEKNVLAIWSFGDEKNQVVRFIVVTPNTIPSSDEVQIFPLGVSADFPFLTQIGEVTPEEWQRIERHELSLPTGWDTDHADRIASDGGLVGGSE